jgi:glutamyl-tRNA synthetase
MMCCLTLHWQRERQGLARRKTSLTMHDSGTPAPYLGGAPVVRTRFAPSPTGLMHIGGYRTIIFSWLLARHSGGQFLLRIEDTDQDRTRPEAVADLLEGLKWIGIVPDEGPAFGGQVGPYIQSERVALYGKFADQLIANGAAYRCFCTPERLRLMREEQTARHLPTTRYDRRCRYLPPHEIEANLANRMPFVVRLKVPEDGVTICPDALRGEIEFQNQALDDAVLLKSDGFATYHLASVVDDYLMGITHVLRGDEWLPSAPLHVLVHQGLRLPLPVFAHVPQVLGPDHKKLSKRTGAEPMLYYRDQGYLPEAVINYLVLLGWSYDDKTDILSVGQMIESFGLKRVHTAGGLFDLERLRWMNGVYIRQMPIDELVERTLPYLERPHEQGGLPDDVARPLDRAFVARVLQLDQERMKTLADAAELISFFFRETLHYPSEWLIGKGLDAAQSLNGLERAYRLLSDLPSWDPQAMEDPMRALADELGVKIGALFMSVRVAVTGRKETPPLFETMGVLGRERSLARLQDGISRLHVLAAV